MVNLTKEIIDQITPNFIPKIISAYIDEFASKHSEFIRRYNAYWGDAPINNRIRPEGMPKDRSNAKLANDYRGIIVDQVVDYVVGKPIKVEIKDEKIKEELNRFLEMNNTHDLDFELVRYMSACGQGARLLYNKKGEKNFRMMNIAPWEVVFIRDGTTGDLQYAFIYYKRDEYDSEMNIRTLTYIEWYDKENVTYLVEDSEGSGNYIVEESHIHNFSDIPLIEFKNNSELMSDFHKVESLIDGYDELLSLNQDEMIDLRNAYMVFQGLDGVQDEELARAKNLGGFAVPEDGNIKYLTRDINDNFNQHHKITLNDNIHRFAQRVDLSDEKFSGAAQTGESRKYKLVGLENAATRKESKIKMGYKELFRVLSTGWEKMGVTFDYLDINFKFTRNLPVDMLYHSQIQSTVAGFISDETRLGLFPPVLDPKDELIKLREDTGETPYAPEVPPDELTQ